MVSLQLDLPRDRYTVAYAQYFDDEIKRNNGDWKKVLKEYLFPGPEPLINGCSGGRTFQALEVYRLRSVLTI
jgi:hypothetical protein